MIFGGHWGPQMSKGFFYLSFHSPRPKGCWGLRFLFFHHFSQYSFSFPSSIRFIHPFIHPPTIQIPSCSPVRPSLHPSHTTHTPPPVNSGVVETSRLDWHGGKVTTQWLFFLVIPASGQATPCRSTLSTLNSSSCSWPRSPHLTAAGVSVVAGSCLQSCLRERGWKGLCTCCREVPGPGRPFPKPSTPHLASSPCPHL